MTRSFGGTDLLPQIVAARRNSTTSTSNGPALYQVDPGSHARHPTQKGRNEVPLMLDAQIEEDAAALRRATARRRQLAYTVRNTMRSVGARISARIVLNLGMSGLPPGHLTLRLRAAGGQSLGAFAAEGLKIEVFGDAE